jgi:hypothetical protein
MNNEKRIQFDWEKYQSGEFEAVCRDGIKPEQIVYFPNAQMKYVFCALVHGDLKIFTKEGFYYSEREKNSQDLFLIPKTKKFQSWINCYDEGAAVSWSNKELAKQYENMHNGFVKTILIEWEG